MDNASKLGMAFSMDVIGPDLAARTSSLSDKDRVLFYAGLLGALTGHMTADIGAHVVHLMLDMLVPINHQTEATYMGRPQ